MNTFKFSTQALLACFCLVFLLTGCKKDDDTPTQKNEFTANGTTIDLPNGFITAFGENSDVSYDWDINLTSASIDSMALSDEVGVGSIVYLDLNSDSADGLTAGTYEWAEDRAPFTIVDGFTGVNYNLNEYSGDYGKEAIGGTVEVSFSGDDTIIDFELTMSDNMVVSGYYKGALVDLN